MQADFDVADFENPQDTKGVYGKFYWHPKKDEDASATEGRPIFKEVEYIEIIAAGNANNIIRRPATDMDKRRFSKTYSMFKEGDSEQLVGTPLSEVTWIGVAQIEELLYRKVRTVEQLAELNDSVCAGSPGLFDLKRKAMKYITKAQGDAPFTALAKENDELKARIAALEASLIGIEKASKNNKKE